MRHDIARALMINRYSTITERRVDITTVGARSGKRHRIEIWFYRAGNKLYLTGRPGPRAWYANLLANPQFTFHLKEGVAADLPATAVPVTDEALRRKIFTEIIEDILQSPVIPRPDPPLVLVDWIAGSPLVEIHFTAES